MSSWKMFSSLAGFLCASAGITVLTATATSRSQDKNDVAPAHAGLGAPPPLEVGDSMIIAGRHVGSPDVVGMRTNSSGPRLKNAASSSKTGVFRNAPAATGGGRYLRQRAAGALSDPSEPPGPAVAVNENRVEVVIPSARVTGPTGTSPRCTGAFCEPTKAIGEVCDCHAECNDDLRCNGEERCEDDGTGTFKCVEGAGTQPSESAGCLEDADMPGGDIPGDSGNWIDRCPNGDECTENTSVPCLEPQICVEVTCASDFCTDNYCGNGTPGSGDCATSDPTLRNFCFDAAGGTRGSRCVDDATKNLAADGGPGTCTIDADCLSGTCLTTWGICSCVAPTDPPGSPLGDARCYNNDCNEARGYCNPTGYECDHMLPFGHADAGKCALVIGTCCVPGANPAVDAPECIGTNILDCNNDPLGNGRNGTWTSDREPNRNNTDDNEIGCLNNCARYSSGIRYPGQGNSVGGGAPGVVDLGPVVEVPCNNNGFESIGDDYILAGGQPIVLERFSFTGGVDSVIGTTLVFQFFDTSLNLAAELYVAAGRTKGIRTYGSRQNPIYRNGAMQQPIIPPEGFIVMKSPTIDTHGERDVQGHWFTTSAAPIYGSNNPNSMWINGVVADHGTLIGAGNDQVLSFELRGVPLSDTPQGSAGGAEACCDALGTCTDTLPWLCSTCQSGGAAGEFCTADDDCWRCSHDAAIRCWSDAYCDDLSAGATCDITPTCSGGSFMAKQIQCQEDSHCPESSPGANDATCVFYANALSALTEEFSPLGYCLNTCLAAPCTGGACCHSNLTCAIEPSQAVCTDAGGAWQGYGEDCDPNCCPAGSTGGDFCGEAVPYVLSVPSVPGEAFVQTITTTTADSVVGPGTGPIEGECEFTSCSVTGYCAAAPGTSCSVVAQDCAGATGPCIDRRCRIDGDCPGGETCRRKPCAHQKPMGHPLACAPGRCQSDNNVGCRTAGDCPLGIGEDNCLSVETCERFDCGDPNIPSLGWRVAGSDPVRWEAFTLNECAEVTIDYCCTDDNPNHPDGIAQPQNEFFDICEPGETRPKYCEGLREPDYPTGTKCDYCAADETIQCATDADCSAVGGVCVKGVDVCLEGTCSGAGEPCHDSNECPLGTCTGAVGLPCRRNGECPSGETCDGGSLCVGGQACERLRDFCGPEDLAVVEPIYPDPDGTGWPPIGWYCGGGDLNWATVWELPPGNYYFPIRALQTCASTGANCNSDNDCQAGDVCQEYEHEYQIHITTRRCPLSTCCRLGEICEGGNVNNPGDVCQDSSSGTCETSSDPCSTNDDCEPGICLGGTGDACTTDSDCTQPEICQDDGFCGIRSGTACTSDADCTVTYTRGDNVTLTETCRPDGLCGYTCHRTYAKPAVMTPSDFCPTAAGAICVGFESCILTDCPQLVCSDDFSTCAGAGDCTQGTCQTWDGGGSMAACHRDSDCPPGICPVSPFQYCRHDDECWGFVGCMNPEPEICVGGASCDPHQCVGDQPLCSLTDQPTCENTLGGFWREDVDFCFLGIPPPSENTCFIGACCTDDTVDPLCKDAAPFDTLEGCATWGGASVFVPGANCDADPCPACEIEDADNCQFFDVSTGFISRCDAQSGTSIPNWRCADDFVSANVGLLDRVCWWPAFAPVGGGPECNQPGERPPDDWTLRVYPDLGHIPDEGAELGPAGGQTLNVDATAPIVGRVWQNSAPVDEPILLLANECYWIEINGAGNDTCDIFWATSNRGNDYSMQDFNFPDFGRYTSEDASNADFAWCVSTGIVTSGPTEAGCPDVAGACCACGCPGQDPICQETTLDECASVLGCEFSGKWKIYRRCDTDGTGTGDGDKCWEDADCDSSPGAGDGICTVPEGGQCAINPCGGEPVNDDCENAITVSHIANYCVGDPGASCDLFTNTECTGAGTPSACCTGAGTGTCIECPAGDGPCLPHDINEANNPIGSPNGTPCNDIRCATTDGPPTGCAIGGGDLSFDVWYEYVAPICGTITVQNCNSLPIYDGFGAVYRKSDFTPGSECTDIIARGASEAACNDDGCGPGGPWSYQLDVVEGEELIIRMGAWFNGEPDNYARAVDEGCFELNLEPNVGSGCPPDAFPPLEAPFPHDRRKNRYISFDPNKDGDGPSGSGEGNDGINVAFKVELLSINMGSCDDGTGGNVDFCRIDRGDNDCNACSGSGNACISASVDCDAGETCVTTGAACVNDLPNSGGSNVGIVWWVGSEHPSGNGVHLLVSEPFRKVSDNWPNPVHVGDCEVVPQAAYGVTAVDTTGGSESDDQLVVFTTQFPPVSPPVPFWWGDAVGQLRFHCNGDIREPLCIDSADCGGDPCERAWELPNGVTGFDDITAALWTMAPEAGITVSADITWVDLYGNGSFLPDSQNYDPPDYQINVSELQQHGLAFGGAPYKFYDPKDCPNAADWPGG